MKESLADIKRQEDKETTFPGDTLMAAVLIQASATVWSGSPFPPLCSEFTGSASHIHNIRKKRWQTFVKCSLHKAAIVERSQHQNDNVDSGCCLPTGLLQWTALVCSEWEGCTVFVHRGGNNTCTLHVCRWISGVGQFVYLCKSDEMMIFRIFFWIIY